MSKARDDKGRFISEIREDAEGIFNICLIIYKLFPLTIIAILAFKYFDVFKFVNEMFKIIGCGHANCHCVCDNEADKKNLKIFN